MRGGEGSAGGEKNDARQDVGKEESMHPDDYEVDDGYTNEAQRHCAAIRSGWDSDEDPKNCACHGGGWILSNYDTWEKCPLHEGRHPEDIAAEQDEAAWREENPEEAAAWDLVCAEEARTEAEESDDEDLPF